MIDDDAFFLKNYSQMLSGEYEVFTALASAQGLSLLKKVKAQALLLDITLQTEKEGLEILPQLKAQFPGLQIIVVTNWDSHTIFKEAILQGADDFFIKSEDLNNLKLILRNALLSTTPQEFAPNSLMVAHSPKMQQVIHLAKKVALTISTVLISGESGTGKDLLARYIHQCSKKKEGPFVAINCAAYPDTLFESEMFGHEKGSFTGASKQYKGKLESADSGTIFFDEVADLSPHGQASLLRAVQEREFVRLGGNETIKVDVRFIAALTSNLKTLVEKGEFRDDLYYRLSVFDIEIPPLREREEDILPIANYFLNAFSQQYKKKPKHLSQSAMIFLKNYNFPGNVRELSHIIERAVIECDGREIRPAHLHLPLANEPMEGKCYEFAKTDALQNFQKQFIKAALARNKGNISAAAKEMGLSRQSVQKLIKELGLTNDL
jgi:DNA-binding NtrC family response regulator